MSSYLSIGVCLTVFVALILLGVGSILSDWLFPAMDPTLSYTVRAYIAHLLQLSHALWCAPTGFSKQSAGTA